MLRLLIKYGIFILLFVVLSEASFSQNALKARERISQLKKIKLLEILNLDEQQSQSFLVKYTSYEKKIEEKKKKLDEAVMDLESSLKNKEDLSGKTQKVNQYQKEFMDLLEESSKSMKSILNEENYAKYIIFEHRFKDEIQKIIMKNMKNRKEKGGL